MPTVTCQITDSHLWLWIGLDDIKVEHRSDYYPVLREWMEAFITGSPFVLEDAFDDPWINQNAEAYPGPKAYWCSKVHRYALLGSTSPDLLRSHQEEYGLSWVGGLRVHVFETTEAMEAQLRAWDGHRVEAEERYLCPPLFTLTTGGDATGLKVEPGRRSLTELASKGEEAAAALGFTWIGPGIGDGL